MNQSHPVRSWLSCLALIIFLPSAFAETQQATPAAPEGQQFSQQFQDWLKTNQVTQTPVSTSSQAPLPSTQPVLVPRQANTGAQYAAPASQRPQSVKKPSGLQAYTYESGQQEMIDAVPPDSPKATNESNMAFNALLNQNMPLTPKQVVKLRQQIDVSQRAASIPANIPPKPVSTTLMVNLAPGTTPPAIRLAQGYVSSLVFVDSTGAPWPIAAFDIGNPKAVNLQWDGKSNIMLIQAVSPYFNGNIVIRLTGLNTPITLELVTAQRVVDYRVDVHVSGIGPNTKNMPLGTSLPGSANQLLLGVLDGIAPPGSKLLNVVGADAQAWLLGNNLYLRTRFTVLSPGWVGKMTSPDGMIAYELTKTSSVLISRYGEPAELKIEGY